MSIEQSIMLETVEQLNELRKKVHELETSRKKHSQQFTTSFAILKDQPPLEIAGIALAVGEWNGVLYTADEIKKLEKQLPGTPVLVEHGRDPDFGNTQVGVFTEAKWDDMIDALLFKAKITDERAIQAVVKKKFPAISLSNRLFYVPDNGKIRGVDLELIEGSLVVNPACEVCYITKTAECLTKIFGNEFKSKMSIDNVEQIGEVNMIMESEKKKKKVVMLRSEEEFYIDIEGVFPLTVDQLNTLAEKLAIDRRFTKKEELELVDAETNAKKKVTRIYYVVYYPYYGYPYGYYGYPYAYPYKYPEKKSELSHGIKTITKDFGEYMVTIEVPIEENVEEEIKKLITEPLKVYVCPACGKEFKTNKEFMEHWMKEHGEEYGVFKGKIPTEEKSEETPEVTTEVKQEPEVKQEQTPETPQEEQKTEQVEQAPQQETEKQEAETSEQKTEETPKEEMKTEDTEEQEKEISEEEKEEQQLSELSPAEALLELIKRDRLEASGTTE